jgi:excisionase family DNA binding protein
MMQKVYTVYEVADILKVSYHRVLRLISDGEVKAFKIGSNYRVTSADLDKFMQGK